MPLDLQTIRSKFHDLWRPAIFFDNPGGTQVAQPVLDWMTAYLVKHSARPSGAISTRLAVDKCS